MDRDDKKQADVTNQSASEQHSSDSDTGRFEAQFEPSTPEVEDSSQASQRPGTIAKRVRNKSFTLFVASGQSGTRQDQLEFFIRGRGTQGGTVQQAAEHYGNTDVGNFSQARKVLVEKRKRLIEVGEVDNPETGATNTLYVHQDFYEEYLQLHPTNDEDQAS